MAALRFRAVKVDAVLATLLAVTVAGAVLRFADLGTQSYWLDEVLTVNLTRLSLLNMIHGIAGQAEAPLYFVVAWIWVRVFGDSEVALRSLSALAGVLTVPVAYSAARIALGRAAGLVTAAFVATSPVLIWYSQEARAYALWILFCALALMFFARVLERPDPRSFAGWAIASALALATHYFAIFLVLPQAAWLLLRTPRRLAARAVGGVGLAGLIILPAVLVQRAHGGVDWIASQPLGDRLNWALHGFVTGSETPVAGSYLTVVVIAWFVAVALVAWRGGTNRTRALVIFGLAAAVIGLSLVGAVFGNDYFLDRNVLPVWLLLAAVLAAGTTVRGVGPIGLIIALVVCAIFVRQDVRTATTSALQRDDLRGAARALGPAQPGRVVVISPRVHGIVLMHYLPHLHGLVGMRRTSEVDVLTCYCGSGWSDPFTQAVLPPAFRPMARSLVQRILVVRYRAPKPTEVTAAGLTSPGRNGSSPYLQTG